MPLPSDPVVRCSHCDAPASPLFVIPERRRPASDPGRGVCRYCFLRLSGIKPTSAHLDPATNGGATR